MVFLTNVNALRAAGAIQVSSAEIKTSIERLSTGSKINGAADDASRLAIAASVNSQILGLNKGIKNGLDGVSLLNTADGALGEIQTMIQRMRELALKASSGASNTKDRANLASEYQQLKAEINRVGTNSQWNGKGLFDGLGFPGQTSILIGSDAYQTISFKLEKLSLSILGSGVEVTEGEMNSLNGWSQLGSDIEGEAQGDLSGRSVSISSDGLTIAIGADYNDGNGNSSGHARVYKYNADSTSWVQLGNDLDGEAAGDQFGKSISLSADGLTVAIGGHQNDGNGSASGHARIFRYSSTIGDWVQLGTDIDGESTEDQSGSSVSISADGATVAIGAPNNQGNGDRSGHVRIYRYDTDTSSWIQIGSDIDGEATQDLSGRATALSADGSTVVIGASNNDGTNGADSGQVRIYRYDNLSGSWLQLGSDVDGKTNGDRSGNSVSIASDGSIIAVGAKENDDAGTDSGHVRIFRYDSSAAGWVQLGGDINGEDTADKTGASISLAADGLTIAIGAEGNDNSGSDSGQVRVYRYDEERDTWLLMMKFGGSREDQLGSAVALSDDGTIVVGGAPYEDSTGSNSGHAVVYRSRSLETSTISTSQSADEALIGIKRSLEQILSMRSSYGAAVNRIEHAINNLTSSRTNLSSTYSQLMDTDYAKETTKLAVAQIKNSGAKSMMAQANLVYPEIVRKLLQK